jgi:hypothetical protein
MRSACSAVGSFSDGGVEVGVVAVAMADKGAGLAQYLKIKLMFSRRFDRAPTKWLSDEKSTMERSFLQSLCKFPEKKQRTDEPLT